MTPEKRGWTLERLRKMNAERDTGRTPSGATGPTFKGKPIPTGGDR